MIMLPQPVARRVQAQAGRRVAGGWRAPDASCLSPAGGTRPSPVPFLKSPTDARRWGGEGHAPVPTSVLFWPPRSCYPSRGPSDSNAHSRELAWARHSTTVTRYIGGKTASGTRLSPPRLVRLSQPQLAGRRVGEAILSRAWAPSQGSQETQVPKGDGAL